MTPSQVGERAEAAVVAALTHTGKAVYLPFGSSGRCDLIYEEDGRLQRVQVKNGILRDRIVKFATCSNTNNVPQDYRSDVDVFGVYCHDLATVFLVPVDQVPLRAGYLRVAATRNSQQPTSGGRSSSGWTGRRRRLKRNLKRNLTWAEAGTAPRRGEVDPQNSPLGG